MNNKSKDLFEDAAKELLESTEELTRDQKKTLQKIIAFHKNQRVAKRWEETGYTPKWLRKKITLIERLVNERPITITEGQKIFSNSYDLYSAWEKSFIPQREFETSAEYLYRTWNLQTARMLFIGFSFFESRGDLLTVIEEERRELLQTLSTDAITGASDQLLLERKRMKKVSSKLFNLQLN